MKLDMKTARQLSLHLATDIRVPQENFIQKIVNGLLSRWQFLQCAGAVDGTHVPILEPTKNDTDYFNQKGFHVLVHYRYRFMDVYNECLGSVHDARILTNSDLFAKGEEGTLLPDSKRMINGCNAPLNDFGCPCLSNTFMTNEGQLQ